MKFTKSKNFEKPDYVNEAMETLNFLEKQILILLTEIYTLIYTKYKEGVDYYDDSKSI